MQREASGAGPSRSGLEHVHSPDHKLAADWTLAHALPTFGAGDHVAAFKQHAIDHRVHADPAKVVVLVGQRRLLSFCQGANKAQLEKPPQDMWGLHD